EDPMSRRDASVGGAAERRLEGTTVEPGIGERGTNRGDAHLGLRFVAVPAERVDADAGDLNPAHAGAYAQVVVPSPSGTTTNRTGMPSRRAEGSASTRRVTTRSLSSLSSTMPNP